jgi:putative membrane-bound dehydrogenase-like protein
MVGPLWAQLAPDAEIRDLQPSPDIEVSLFASEPMITNPAAIDIDTHGRVWVAEIQWYRKAAKDPPADKIKVLEDTDGDGKADRVTVFAEGVFAPMSICVAGSKVYVATSPDLWVYEDNDGDLKADGPPTKLLTGFGTRNHDHTAHSLVLGPDHKWWMAHGDTGVDVTGTDGSHIKYKWGTMLRGELDGSQLEIVAENFRNPYEICVDSFGNAFCSDNDNDGNFSARVCWIMDGGDYGWFGGPPGPRGSVPASIPFSEHWHFRGHIPGYVPATLVTGFGSPCGMCFYEGDAFPCLKNMPLHTDPGPREVRAYPHTKSGYGFKATSRTFLTSKDDKYFRPDDICTAPDGTLFVSDWYDGGVGGHAYNNPEQGRIFQLTPKAKKPTRVGKPGPYDNDVDALQGLRSPNLATQFLARERLLASGKNAVPELKKLLVDAEPNVRARSLWVLARIFDSANEPCTEVHEQLKSPDPSMRALAVRILHRQSESHGIVGLRLNVCHPDIKVILSMANDPDPEVRREVLLAMPKIPSVEKPDVLAKLAAQYDGNDRYLLEAINIAAGKGQAPAFAESVYNELVKTNALNDKNLALVQILKPSAAIDMLRQQVSAAKDDETTLKLVTQLSLSGEPAAGKALVEIASDAKASPAVRNRAVELLTANLKGPWSAIITEPQTQDSLKHLLTDPATQTGMLDLIGSQKLREFGEDVLALAQDDKVSDEVRSKALAVLVQVRAGSAAKLVTKLLTSDDPGKQATGIATLVESQDWPALKREIFTKQTDPKLQQQALDAMLATTGGALAALKWIDKNELDASLKERAIAKAVTHPDASVRVMYERFIPADQRQQRLGEAIKAADILALKGNPKRGEQIFYESTAAQCKNCHQVNGKGGTLGPDLSAIGKKYERATLLETILEPSKAISHEFVPYLVQTTDGLVYAGFVVTNDEREVVLKDINSKMVRIRAKDVDVIEPQTKSLMPELVLRDVTAQDAADLLAFMEGLVGAK